MRSDRRSPSLKNWNIAWQAGSDVSSSSPGFHAVTTIRRLDGSRRSSPITFAS